MIKKCEYLLNYLTLESSIVKDNFSAKFVFVRRTPDPKNIIFFKQNLKIILMILNFKEIRALVP